MKAVLLSAGLGTRLKPITQKIPKPGIPILNVPLLYINLHVLKETGVKEVYINVHHLSDRISKLIEQRPAALQDLKIHLSDETDEIMGTGGGLKRLESHLRGEQDFIVMNSDILTDASINKAVLKRREKNSSALMVVTQHPDLGTRYRPVLYSPEDLKLQYVPPHYPASERTDLQKGLFTGIQVLSPKVFDFLPPEIPCDMIEYGYARMLGSGEPLHVLPVQGRWLDVGTPHTYLEATIALMKLLTDPSYNDILRNVFLKLSPTREEVDNIWIGPDVVIPDDCTLVPPVFIGSAVEIGSGTTLGPFVVLNDGLRLKKNTTMERTIVLPGTASLDSERYSNKIVFGHSVIDAGSG